MFGESAPTLNDFSEKLMRCLYLLERSDVWWSLSRRSCSRVRAAYLEWIIWILRRDTWANAFWGFKKDCFRKALLCVMCYILAKMQIGFSFLSAEWTARTCWKWGARRQANCDRKWEAGHLRVWVFKNCCCFRNSLSAGWVTYSNIGGVLFSLPIFIFENLNTSCIKLSTLEPFEDQDLPMNELDGSEEEEIVTVVLEEVKEKWDCESICSKYLSVYFTIKY